MTVIGPRQTGKTTLCREVFSDHGYVSLEDPDVRDFALSDPRGFLSTYKTNVIIDEIQRVPSLLSYIQRVVDETAVPGQFILTGSHQLKLAGAISQSLAGRLALLTLLPLTFNELSYDIESIVNTCMIRGFMPEVHQKELDPSRYYRSYFRTYVERDVGQMVQLRDFAQFEKCVRLCAGRVGQVLNISSLASDIGVSTTTVTHWISILEASFICFRLQPYFENFGKRLIKSPKLYFIDTGFVCWLLGIENEM